MRVKIAVPQLELGDLDELVGGVGLADRAGTEDDRRHAGRAERRARRCRKAHRQCSLSRPSSRTSCTSRSASGPLLASERPLLFMKGGSCSSGATPSSRVLGDVSHQVGIGGGGTVAGADAAVDRDRHVIGHGVDAHAAMDRRHAHGRPAAERMRRRQRRVAADTLRSRGRRGPSRRSRSRLRPAATNGRPDRSRGTASGQRPDARPRH